MEPEPTMSETLDRRTLLKLGGAAAAGLAATSFAPTGAWAATRARKPKWPSAKLPASAAASIDETQFLTTKTLRALGQEANLIGLRGCGSVKHEAYVRRLARYLVQAGVKDVRLEPVPMKRWEAKPGWSLTVDGTTFPHLFYMPYTRDTGAAGLSAPMAFVPPQNLVQAQTHTYGVDVKGKIAVLELGSGSIPYAEFAVVSYPGAIQNPQGQIDVAGSYTRPFLSIAGFQSTLDDLLAAGAVGVIGILTEFDGPQAVQQYTPYDARMRALTGLWIDRSGGARLKPLAQAGARATMVLRTEVEDVVTHNVVGFIPGSSPELTVLHTHTDGSNGMEENGQIPVLAAAQYLARLPTASLERTVMVMLSAGHFAGGVGIRRFVRDHAGDLLPRMTSITTLEHVGCLEQRPDGKGGAKLTGKPELAAWFTPDASGMVDALIAHERRDGLSGSVIRPFVAGAPSYYDTQPVRQIGWPGEGTYWWWFGGLTCGNQITGPYNLLTADLDITGLVDYDIMRTNAMSTVLSTLQLAGTSRGELTALPE